MCVCGLTYPECKAHAPYFTVIMASLSLPYFSTLSHKRYDCRKIFSISLYRLLRPLGWVKYSSTLFKTSALKMRVGGGSAPRPGRFTPGRTRYPLNRRLGGPPGRSGRGRKISPHTGFRSPDRPARSESLYRLSYPGRAGKYLLGIKCVSVSSTTSV